MAKKGKKAKAAAAATASQTAFTTASDLDFQLSHNTDPSDEFSSQLNRILEEKSTSFSLPSSPVIKVTHSIQPSPALSASVTQAIDEDFKPISLPPLNISEILEPGPPPDIDWSLFDTQPLRGKKRAKPKQAIARLRSPLREDTSHEELAEAVAPSIQEELPQVEAPTNNSAEASPKSVPGTPPQQHINHPYFPPYPHHPGYYPRSRMSYPMPYGYGPHSGDGSPYQSPYGPYSPYHAYPHPRKLERHDSMASRGSGSGDVVAITPPQMIADNSSAIEDDPSDLLGRVHHAIPDLELLLRRYKETHGELGLREALVRKKEAESAEVVKRKEEHIDRLMGQFHDAEKKHAREYNKLRLHIGNLEENMKDLEERLHVSESQRKKETASNKELSEEKIALVRERMLVAKAAADERDRLVADYENSRTDAQKQLDAERIRVAGLVAQKEELESKANSTKKEFERQLNSTKMELERQLNSTKDELIAQKAEHENKVNSTRIELENKANSTRMELEMQLNSTKAGLEEKVKMAQEAASELQMVVEELKTELAAEKAANANGWEEKRNLLVSELEEQKQAMVTTHEEAIEALKKEHKDDLNEQTRAFVGLQESLNLKMTAENQNLVEEIANLKMAWDEDKARFEKMIDELKGVAQGMEEEKGRLEKIVEQFSEETDVKSKGDLHYIEAFKQLSDLIFELSSKYFSKSPRAVPPEFLAHVPEYLPSVTEDSVMSQRACGAYVAHLISSILLKRVFTPFLFGLGRGSEETATLLKDVSDQLRAKNSRKEATWRQHTLLAAYTTTDAKLRMNKEAGSVVDDIVTTVLPLTSESLEKTDDIRSAVKRIVKLAVETWRYAKLERERIEAVLPPVGEASSADDGKGFWFSFTGQEDAGAGASHHGNGSRTLLLRVFPVIHREPVQEVFRLPENDCNDKGCVYNKGWALYAD